jgi:hypothetical protein
MPARADRRLVTLRAALGFLQLAPRASELRLLHRWLDSWTGLGLITVGVERLGPRLSLTHVADGEWRAAFAPRLLHRWMDSWAGLGLVVGLLPKTCQTWSFGVA